MKTKLALAVFLLLLVLGGLAGVKGLQIKKLIAAGQSFVPPAESVATVAAREEQWPVSLTAIATITAVQGVMITPDIPGTVREIAFESGATVAAGDLLVRLDTSLEAAQLRALAAQVDLARLTVERVRKLRAENTVSPSELDASEAALTQAQANADAIRATIEKKTLRAPFAGRLGIRQVNLGQYMDTGKPIVSLQALNPVYADFSLPQQELARIKTGMPVRLSTDAYEGRIFAGTLTAINPDLDQGTRSVHVQATFTNAEALLRPGMFARAEVVLPEEQKVLVVPATAVLSTPGADVVYVVESKPGQDAGSNVLTVRQQLIRTGRTRGDFVSVDSGLKAGQSVVSSGIFKLRNGMAVTVNTNLAPRPAEAPRPSDS